MKSDIALFLAASRVVTANLNSEAAITALLQLLYDLNGLAKARVLLSNDTNSLEIKYAYDLTSDEINRGKYAIGEGVTGKVMETGQIALVPDIRHEPSYLSKTTDLHTLANETIAYIAVPLLHQLKPKGVLAVYRSQPDADKLHRDIDVLQVIAAMIQLVLEIDSLVTDKTRTLKTENKELRKALLGNSLNHDIIGTSPALKQAIKMALQAAATNATVMLYGESGTGKEKFARMIHFSSSQKDQPFITVNCAAIPEQLLESELFGHVKGSFTGAISNKIGKFEAANNGTLFLDEIGDMNLDLQAKLLRALQEKSIQRVGSNQETVINVRVITATHKNIKDAVNQGKFRLDLYYRLNVLPIELPPLRERSEDIKLLALFFLNRLNQRYSKNISLGQEVLQCLAEYEWPGNIRQLENVIERMVILSENDSVSVGQTMNFLNEENRVKLDQESEFASQRPLMFNRPYVKVSANEKDKILSSLKATRGNKTQAALNLGMTPRQLHYRIEKLEIET